MFPRLLGDNVAEAAPLVALALFVPGFRNLVEYQAELLFARGQTVVRAVNLALLAALKGGLLWLVLDRAAETLDDGAVAEPGVPDPLSGLDRAHLRRDAARAGRLRLSAPR